MKAENFEYKQKEKDYNTLHNQLLDLERRFRLLQEEKVRAEREAKDRESINYKNNDDLQLDVKSIKNTFEVKQQQLHDLNEQVINMKNLAGRKSEEISNYKRELAIVANNSNDLLKAKRQLQDECALEASRKKEIELEADRLITFNDKISREEAESALRLRENERAIQDISDHISIITKKIMDTNIMIKSSDNELSVVLDNQQDLQRRLDGVVLSNSQLQNENRDLGLRAHDIDVQLDRVNVRYKDTLITSEKKAEELRMAKTNLDVSEKRMIQTMNHAKDIQRENEALQTMLDKHRNDAELQKRLREQEFARKLEIEQQRKRLEKEVINRDLEARSAKKELEIIQYNKGRLIDDHFQLNNELNALKEHAELLESQNTNVNSILMIS